MWEFMLPYKILAWCYQVLCNNLAISCLHLKGFFFILFILWCGPKRNLLDSGLAYHSRLQKRFVFRLNLTCLWQCFGNGIFLNPFLHRTMFGLSQTNAQECLCLCMRLQQFWFITANFSMLFLTKKKFVFVCSSYGSFVDERDSYCLINFLVDFPTFVSKQLLSWFFQP